MTAGPSRGPYMTDNRHFFCSCCSFQVTNELTNPSRPPEDLSDNGGNTLFFEAKDPKARQHRLRRAVIGLDFLALLRFSPSSSGEVTESDRVRDSTFFRRYAPLNSVNT